MTETQSKPRYVWEVYHPGPSGDWPIGFFWSKDDAQKAKADWDSAFPTSKMDHAIITRHEVK